VGESNLFLSIAAVQERFLGEGIPSIVIGGVAVAVWGEPRVTRDVDLKVLLGRDEAEHLLEILSPDYYPLVKNPMEFLRKQALVFVRDHAGTRIDLLLADTPYDIKAIQRGQDVEIQNGISIRVCSPEDLIIYKLISTRSRDHEDAGSVVQRQGNLLDEEYILEWLHQFEKALDDSTLITEFQSLESG
jgi:Nucleotidyl transferase of unknown function (DUF2204)